MPGIPLRQAIKLHLSGWACLFLLYLLANWRGVLRGRPALLVLCIGVVISWVVLLWGSSRKERWAWRMAHVLSASLLLLAAIEGIAALLADSTIEVTRYPYPYRMHGFAPHETAAANRFGATTEETGLRSPGPIPPKADGEYRVLVLGGSTIFGVGAADDETAPRYLERILSDELAGHSLAAVERVRVLNGGQGAYNSTQELVFFVTELALREPDLVVVVDGYNDVHHAIVWGVPPPANYVTMDFVEGLDRMPMCLRRLPSWSQGVSGLLAASRLLDWTGVDAAGLISKSDLEPRVWRAEPLSLVHEPLVLHRLVMNWTLLQRLSESLDLPCLFALQPVVFVKETLAPGEREFVEKAEYAACMTDVWRKLEVFVRTEAARLGLRHFAADRHIRDRPEELFTDYCHLTPEGNRLLARAVADSVLDLVRAGAQRPNWDGVRYPFPRGDPFWKPPAVVH